MLAGLPEFEKALMEFDPIGSNSEHMMSRYHNFFDEESRSSYKKLRDFCIQLVCDIVNDHTSLEYIDNEESLKYNMPCIRVNESSDTYVIILIITQKPKWLLFQSNHIRDFFIFKKLPKSERNDLNSPIIQRCKMITSLNMVEVNQST